MLTIKTTPNLYGVSIQGDYNDLNTLYDALSRYLEFYQEHAVAYPYHEYEYLLSLNYDLRHACQGDRGYTLVENNASQIGLKAECIYELPADFKKDIKSVRSKCKKGNLYFSVEILYPLVFHYLISLERILEDYASPQWFSEYSKPEDEEDEFCLPPYGLLDSIQDTAQIHMFTALLWNNVRELFGNDLALEIYNCFTNQEYGSTHCMYTDMLLHRMMAQFHTLTADEKMYFLLLSLIETMDSDDIRMSRKQFKLCKEQYKKALKGLKDIKKEFPTKQKFYSKLDKAFPGTSAIYTTEFEKFLDKHYGIVEFEEPEW